MIERESIATGLTVTEAKKRFPLRRKCPSDPAPRISSRFYITGDPLDVAKCTEAANITPSDVKEKRIMGHFQPSGRPNILKPQWSLIVVHEPSYDVDACVSALLSLLNPRAKYIRALLKENNYEAGVLTTVTIYEDRAIYSLSANTLGMLAKLHVEWSLDIL